jgi:hypothetical protein
MTVKDVDIHVNKKRKLDWKIFIGVFF